VSSGAVDRAYEERNPGSRRLFEQQLATVPGGYSHAARVLPPFPLFIERAAGSHKWDVDGNEYVDYWTGHGSLLLGHGHPDVVRAVQEQAEAALHGGGETRLGLEWAGLISELVPSAERVRLMASGGEATQMAMRVARAHTGRDRVVKFEGAFHGWHDAVTLAALPPYDVPASAGVPAAVAKTVLALPFNDAAALGRTLAENDDIAAVLVEPGGLYDDTVLSDPAFVRALRELTSAHGVLLIFDEVVTGFRYARGGAQEHFGVTPDLTALGKVIGGGVAAGALAGRAEVMDVLAWRPDPDWQRFRMVPHSGTWNANPLAAAAGVVTLRAVRDTDAVERAAARGRQLVEGLNAVFSELQVEAFAYGRASIFKIGRGARPRLLDGDLSNREADTAQLLAGWGDDTALLRKAMLLQGADLLRNGGFVSALHSDADVQATCEALERALLLLRREGRLD